MLTLAISNDPGTIHCAQAAQAAYSAIESRIPDAMRAAAQASATAGAPAGNPAVAGCETTLVADLASGLDDIEKALKYCRADWIPDDFFLNPSGIAQARPAGPDDARDALVKSCRAEFKSPSTAADPASPSGHGRAVSHLITTLQAIVYIENRKKAAVVSR